MLKKGKNKGQLMLPLKLYEKPFYHYEKLHHVMLFD